MFGEVNRERQLEAILAQVYVLSFGDETEEDYAFERDLSKRLGIDPLTVSKRVEFLVLEESWLQWIGGGGAQLVDDGVVEVEHRIRNWVAAEKPKSSLSDLYESCLVLLKPREWKRFQFLRCLEDLSDGEPTEYVDHDDLVRSLGYEPSNDTLDVLEHLGFIDLSQSRSYRIKAAGIQVYRFREDHLLGLPDDLKFEDFASAIERIWAKEIEPRIDEDFDHSDDYSYVRKGDREFSLPARPAKVIGLLHRAYKSGQPVVVKEVILDTLGYDYSQRVRDVFKPNHLDAWRELVRSAGQGRYRLNI
jgi:hypothetical protein